VTPYTADLHAPAPELRIVPANRAGAGDLDAIFGTKGYPATCQCQKFRSTGDEWWYNPLPREERRFRLRQQTDCGNPDAPMTSGMVAYLGEDPVG
jgi:hypothetical protein